MSAGDSSQLQELLTVNAQDFYLEQMSSCQGMVISGLAYETQYVNEGSAVVTIYRGTENIGMLFVDRINKKWYVWSAANFWLGGKCR